MHRLAIEWHDSMLEGVRRQGPDVLLKMNVYVHRSEGRPGWDGGVGWYQDAEVLIVGATVEREPSGATLDIMDGSACVVGQPIDSLLPLPCDLTGEVTIDFSGHQGTFKATGTGIRITLKGEPGPVEQFNGARRAGP